MSAPNSVLLIREDGDEGKPKQSSGHPLGVRASGFVPRDAGFFALFGGVYMIPPEMV